MKSTADNSKKGRCAKCNNFTWLETHHVLPKSVFGGAGKTEDLCPTCHNEYHKHLGRENLKNPDENFHKAFYRKWFKGGFAVFILLLLYYFYK